MSNQPDISNITRMASDDKVISFKLGDHRNTFTPDFARAFAKSLTEHADKIDKADRDKAKAEIMKRRNVVAHHYTFADWNILDRATRTLIDRIIELETQQEENK